MGSLFGRRRKRRPAGSEAENKAEVSAWLEEVGAFTEHPLNGMAPDQPVGGPAPSEGRVA
jgi:hypothetical protein